MSCRIKKEGIKADSAAELMDVFLGERMDQQSFQFRFHVHTSSSVSMSEQVRLTKVAKSFLFGRLFPRQSF